MGLIVLTQLAMGLGVLAKVALVKLVMDQKAMASLFPRCPSSDCSNRSFLAFHFLKTLKPTTATTATTSTSTSMAWENLSLLFYFLFFFMIEKYGFVLEYIYACLILFWMINLK